MARHGVGWHGMGCYICRGLTKFKKNATGAAAGVKKLGLSKNLGKSQINKEYIFSETLRLHDKGSTTRLHNKVAQWDSTTKNTHDQ